MKAFFSRIKRWWLRRFRGYVEAPPGTGGTNWQQHDEILWAFTCRCGRVLIFNAENYVVREQDHSEGCEGVIITSPVSMQRCSCPVTDARYVKICPGCGLGHWKQAI